MMSDIPLNWDCENCHALQAEIERLNAELQLAWNTCDDAETKERRLRAALERIEGICDRHCTHRGDKIMDIRIAASEALKDESD